MDEDRNREAVSRAIDPYGRHSDFYLFGTEIEGTVVGLIGVMLRPDHVGEIRHIVVHPSARCRGKRIQRTGVAGVVPLKPATAAAHT